MKTFERFFSYLFLITALGWSLSSCVEDIEAGCPEQNQGNGNSNMIILNVNNVFPRLNTPTSAKVKEKIRSLRIIMLSDDYIEVNKVINAGNYPDWKDDATEFSYIFKTPYIKGKKRFFFIANEESFGDNVMYDLTSTPGELNGLSFTEVLNLDEFATVDLSSDKEKGKVSEANGQKLVDILNSIYFAPDYEALLSGEDDDQEIYLPYTAYYSENDLDNLKRYYNDDEISGFDGGIFIVPVATKIEFHFVNNRSHEVKISALRIADIDTENFAFPRVGDKDLRKDWLDENGEKLKLYWANWLAKVSELSWNYQDSGSNEDFNVKYGWISEYTIPATTDPYVRKFLYNGSEEWQIEAASNINEELVGGTLDLGPYYLPESRHMYSYIDPSSKKETIIQRYFLSMNIHDVSQLPSVDPYFEDNPVNNLGSLFRNTHVVINIVLNEGEAGVYAQIEPWIYKNATGWVGSYQR